jgi:hypothetical protein
MSMAHADKALSSLTEEFGSEAYGIYWLIIEEIAGPMEPGKMIPAATHSLARWASICHSSPRRLSAIFERMSASGLVSLVSRETPGTYRSHIPQKIITISAPNILKYRDEYSKKSGQTPDRLRTSSGSRDRGRADTDAEAEERSHSDVEDSPTAMADSLPRVSLAPDDGLYGLLVATWQQAKPHTSENEFRNGYKFWVALDSHQQRLALSNLKEHIRQGVRISTSLRFWLTEDYLRPVNEPSAGRNGSERNQRRRAEVYAGLEILDQMRKPK